MKRKLVVNLMISVMLAMVGIIGVAEAYNFEAKYGDIDLHGQTVNFVLHCNPLEDVEKNHSGRIAEAEEKFNCKIKYVGVPGDSMVESHMNRLLTGESKHDIWLVSSESIWKYFAQDALATVDNVVPFDYFDSLPAEHQNTIKTLSYKNKKYGFSSFGTIFGAMKFVYFNKDMFERAGLDSPYDLYKAEKWNWANAFALAKKLNEDIDGDGEIDHYGFGNISRNDMILSNGGRIFREKDGKWEFTLDEDRALNALNEFYKRVHIEKTVELGDLGGDKFADGMYAMQPLEAWRINYIEKNFKFDYGVVPFPKGPEASRYTCLQPWFETLVLPANAEDKLALVAIADFLWRPEDYNKKTDIINNAPDRLAAKIQWACLNNWDGDSNLLESILPDEYKKAMKAIENGDKTPALAINEIKELAQQTVNEFFGQK